MANRRHMATRGFKANRRHMATRGFKATRRFKGSCLCKRTHQ